MHLRSATRGGSLHSAAIANHNGAIRCERDTYRAVCVAASALALASLTMMSGDTTRGERNTTVTLHGMHNLLAQYGRCCALAAHWAPDTHIGVMLTPPARAKRQAALVVSCGALEETISGASAGPPVHSFLVAPIVPLRDDDANDANATLLSLVSLVAPRWAARRGEAR